MTDRYPRRRFHALAAAAMLLLGLLVVRLAVLQVAQHQTWRQRGAQLSSQEHEVAARRGALLDRLGYPLALTDLRVKVGVTQPAAWLAPDRLATLASVLRLTPEALRATLTGRSGHTYAARDAVLAPSTVDSLRRVQGLSVELVDQRVYPMGRLAAPVLGRVDHRTHGDAGVERACDDKLAGTPGRELVRFDAGYAHALMKSTLWAPVDGCDVGLTLDHRIQMILEEELERTVEESGARQALGIVMEPWSGEVLALAAAPAHAERDEKPLAGAQWRNPTVEDAFEPGSTFKLFTFASLLTRSICDTSQVFDGERDPVSGRGVADFGGFRIHDVHPVGRVSLRHAFEVSSNIVTAKAACRLDPEQFHADLKRFGFGLRTGCGLPSESHGLLMAPARWSKRTLPTLGIGQEISVTIMQLAAGYSALLTDGTLRRPRLIASFTDPQGHRQEAPTQIVRDGLVPPSVILTLRGLCRGVVEDDYGTGRGARVEGLEIGGKTGTAQISGPHGYIDGAYTASFVGFTPIGHPRLLCAIVVHEPHVALRWGGSTAAPCFARVMAKIFSSTDWLDGEGVAPAPRSTGEPHIASAGVLSVPELPQPHAEPAPQTAGVMPDLRGHTADEVLALARARGLRVEPLPEDGRARAIGQLPGPGVELTRSAVIHVAWRREGRS